MSPFDKAKHANYTDLTTNDAVCIKVNIGEEKMTKTNTTTTTAKTRLISYLTKNAGATLTVAQARSRFRIANPTARISELREDGYNIRTTMRRGKDGVARAVYSLARPVKVTR